MFNRENDGDGDNTHLEDFRFVKLDSDEFPECDSLCGMPKNYK